VRSGAGYETKGILWATPLPNIAFPVRSSSDSGSTSPRNSPTWCASTSRPAASPGSAPTWSPKVERRRAQSQSRVRREAGAAIRGIDQGERGARRRAQWAAAHRRDLRSAPVASGAGEEREIEKQIQDQQLAIDKKLYDRSGARRYTASAERRRQRWKARVRLFATGISACYDLSGKRAWIVRGKGEGTEHGNFASPLLCGNRLVVWAKGELRAYDADTGKQAWRNTYTSNSNDSYGSLFRVQVGSELVAGFQAGWFARVSDGKALWGSNQFGNGVQTPVVDGSTIYAAVGLRRLDLRSFGATRTG